MTPLTDDEVLALVSKHVGDADFVKLAKSHEALRNQLERVETHVSVAIKALTNVTKR
jgi:hypothetical protein